MSSIDEINDSMNAAVAAQEAGDYRTALAKVEASWMRICGLPDSEFENERLEWSREGIKELMDWLQRRANAQGIADSQAAGRGALIRPSDIQYKRG